jgi:hypothetical protein
VRLEANTKPPIHDLIHEFLINMAFTMACLDVKKGLKMAFGPLGVKSHYRYYTNILGVLQKVDTNFFLQNLR